MRNPTVSLLFAGVLATTMAISSTARGQATTNANIGADNDFVTKASICGSTEVALGRLAQVRASDPEIRKYADKMVNDHQNANNKLMSFAGQKRISVPREIDKKHQECIDKFAKLQGKDFDKEYMKQMVKDHEEAIKLFEKESEDGKDSDLKAWAGDTLPKLKEHLKEAKKLAGEDDSSSKSSK